MPQSNRWGPGFMMRPSTEIRDGDVINRTIFNATLSIVTMSMTLSVLALDSFTLANRSRAARVERDGDVPLGAIIRTDERYNRDSLFFGPRGWDYWNLLQNPLAYQDPNLWPD